MHYTQVPSPIGTLLLTSDGTFLTGLYPGGEPESGWECREDVPVFDLTRQWLASYFAGTPEPVDPIPLKIEGTPFRKRVWQILMTIPWGQVRTYGDIARQLAQELGREKMSAQAVGQAVGSNPISILIPCHRCVGVGGKLTGYAWGTDKKKWLLDHEARKGRIDHAIQ